MQGLLELVLLLGRYEVIIVDGTEVLSPSCGYLFLGPDDHVDIIWYLAFISACQPGAAAHGCVHAQRCACTHIWTLKVDPLITIYADDECCDS